MVTTVHDAHVHVWSADQIRYPLAPGLDDGDLWLPSFTPDDHESIAGGRLPINLVQMTWYGLHHRYILDLIESEPARFTGTGIVPAICDVSLPRPDRTMLELARGGIRAFRLRGRAAQPAREHAEHWLEHKAYELMFGCAAEHGLVLSFLCAPSDLTEIGRMCERFPEASVILDHCGGVRIRNSTIESGDLRSLLALGVLPGVNVKFGPVHGLGGGVAPFADVLPLLHAVVDAYGAGRVLWESDLGGPVQMQNSQEDFGACVALVSDVADFLTAEQREQILGGTARRLLWGRPPPP
ncbi:uncharacterized protein METZ01_LOCUS232398 [marine metagenome]|uniref:Amidohydrolase-related domain-containing protein n=1 Tax=marine metagenome TaxID=408172 RepID=A0A382GXA3_9ZZZZ